MDDRRESSARRFVLLRHELPGDRQRDSHWDLMLEFQGILLTWSLPSLRFSSLPQSFASLGIRRLVDHRAIYLDYEGPVSGDRGFVQRTDSGVYQCEPYQCEPTEQNAEEPRWTQVQLEGKQYRIGLELPMEVWQTPNATAVERPIDIATPSQTERGLANESERTDTLDGRLVYFQRQSFS